MSEVTLYYFNIKALGEGPRLLLAYGGQKFTDRRLTYEEWPQFKNKMPFGTLPVLEMDGRQFAQSLAICRFLGKKYGLAGDNVYEAHEIDQNVDFYQDLHFKTLLVHYEKDEAAQKKKHEDHTQNVYPDLLKRLNALIEKNNGYIANGKLSWGDFFIAGLHDYMKFILQQPDFEQKYPALKRLADNVYNIPQVKAFADSAPATLDGW